MKELTDILNEGLIGARDKNIKSIGVVLWNTFERCLDPGSSGAGVELYRMMSDLPGASRYSGGAFDDRYIKKNDPIIISFPIWNNHPWSSHPGTHIYLGWPKEDTSADIDLIKKKIKVRVGSSLEDVPPFVYTTAGKLWIRGAYDSWIIGEDSVVWPVFRDVMMDLGR